MLNYQHCLIIFQVDNETDVTSPAAKRVKREPSENGEEGVSAEEMSLYYSSPTSSDTSQVCIEIEFMSRILTTKFM